MIFALLIVAIVYALILAMVIGIGHYYRDAKSDIPWWKRWIL